MVLKWINFNPIILPYVFNQKQSFLHKIDLQRNGYSISVTVTHCPDLSSRRCQQFRRAGCLCRSSADDRGWPLVGVFGDSEVDYVLSPNHFLGTVEILVQILQVFLGFLHVD